MCSPSLCQHDVKGSLEGYSEGILELTDIKDQYYPAQLCQKTTKVFFFLFLKIKIDFCFIQMGF